MKTTCMISLAMLAFAWMARSQTALNPSEAFSFESDNTLMHIKSGTRFPQKYNGYARIQPNILDNDGNQVAVGYRSLEPIRAEYTEYVRLADIPAEQYYLSSKAAILEMNTLMKLVYENTVESQYSGMFLGSTTFDGKIQNAMSILIVMLENGWLIKLRVTLPFPQEQLSTNESVQQFFNSIPVFHTLHALTELEVDE
jgi:hypothetical protein